MPDGYAVLIVEDSEDDAVLLTRQLEHAGILGEHRRVDTRETMAAALQEHAWDVVVADYVMPHFDGLEAIELVRDSGLDIPVVVVSGKIGEDVAVAAMRAGAADYVMKSSLARLPSAIEREVREAAVRADRRQAESELRVYRSHLEDLVSQRTRDLETANSALQGASDAKSEFLSQMSHELRTPLNSILGFTSLLLEQVPGPLNEEQVHQLRMVKTGADCLLSLVNGLLDLARIEAGRVQLNIECVPIEDLVRRVSGLMMPLAEERELTFDVKVENGIEPLCTDGGRLQQVLVNLLSNAIKFTNTGGVTLLVRSGEADTVCLEVIDTGIGIDAEYQETIFERFGQAPHGPQTVPGTGLGLTITRELVVLLGGTITVASVADAGSTFTVCLPRKCTPAGAPA